MGIVSAHLDHLRHRNLRPSTIDQRRRALARLARWHDSDLLAATTDDLTAFLDARDLSPEARATEISHLRGFYRWAVFAGHIDIDPTLRLVRPKLPRRLPRPMSDGDLDMALRLAPDRVRPILLFAAYCGLRAIEISRLRADDLWWDHRPPVVVIREGKGGHAGYVPLPPNLEAELASLDLPRRGWLVPRRDDRPGPLPAHMVSKLANDFLHSVGIDATLHQIRHWYGTRVYSSTRDLRVTQEALRHSSPVSTALYTKVVPDEVAAAVSDLSVRAIDMLPG